MQRTLLNMPSFKYDTIVYALFKIRANTYYCRTLGQIMAIFGQNDHFL